MDADTATGESAVPGDPGRTGELRCPDGLLVERRVHPGGASSGGRFHGLILALSRGTVNKSERHQKGNTVARKWTCPVCVKLMNGMNRLHPLRHHRWRLREEKSNIIHRSNSSSIISKRRATNSFEQASLISLEDFCSFSISLPIDFSVSCRILKAMGAPTLL